MPKSYRAGISPSGRSRATGRGSAGAETSDPVPRESNTTFSHIATKIPVSSGISATLKLVVYNANGKKVSETTVRGSHHNRYVWKFGKMLQVSFDDGQFSHIHCKDSACGNEWSAREGSDPSGHFDIELTSTTLWKVTCKKCGRSTKRVRLAVLIRIPGASQPRPFSLSNLFPSLVRPVSVRNLHRKSSCG